MGVIELFLIAIGLSMDAFAVSICKGLSQQKMNWKNAGIIGLYFGGFQALMPLLGYILGSRFKGHIVNVDHWIAFVLLGFIGLNMIKESFQKEEQKMRNDMSFKTMIALSVATSIDALAVGITFAFFLKKIETILAIVLIGSTTFLLSIVGVKIGNVFGVKYKSKAELAGGILLIFMGIKILLEHLEIISF